MNDHTNDSGAMTDAERARAAVAQLKKVHAFDLAYEMLISMVSFGYQKMGLTDETRELRDLDDAKVAIELMRAVLDALEHEKGAALTGDLRSTLAQMQLNYARVVQLERAEPATAKTPAAAAKEPAATTEEAAAKEPAAAEPGPARPAAKRPASGKPAAKKPAAKKPAPKKSAAKKKPPAAD